MHLDVSRLRWTLRRRQPRGIAADRPRDVQACSWEAMRDVYQEQAARGIPEAIEGLERIEQGRWPSSGRARQR